jgi:hypothetical protein
MASAQSVPLANGQVRVFEVDEEAIARIVPWARRNQQLLTQELEEMAEYFPIFYTTIVNHDNSDRPIPCPECGERIIFTRGMRCANPECGLVFRNPPNSTRLAFLGELRTELLIVGKLLDAEDGKIQGRACLKEIYDRLERMPEGSGRSGRDEFLKLINTYFLTLEGNIYFTPPVEAVYPNSWPSEQPTVYLEEDYFKILNTTGEHTFPSSGSGFRSLCIYSSWHRATLREVLQQRIVPRVIIDFMIADLKAVDALRRVLDSIGTSAHDVYNLIGRDRQGSERFRNAYHRHVGGEQEFRI